MRNRFTAINSMYRQSAQSSQRRGSAIKLGLCGGLLAMAGLVPPALAVSKNVDLNGDGVAESPVALTVVTTYPVKIQNKITNKAVGQAFTFRWPSAGPGGFSSSLKTGTSTGVGTIWTWQTTQQVYSFTGNSCSNDICFTRTTPGDGATRSGGGVPGRSLTTSGVSITSESLTSSLITFFSPPQELFSITSSVDQLAPGVFRYKTIVENFTPQPVSMDQAPGPPGCDSLCDNGVREGIEICDGSDLNGISCGTYGQDGTLHCNADCASFDTEGCFPFVCGNGVREGNEVCDGSDLNGLSCGDLGGTGGTLACRSDCTGFNIAKCEGICGNSVREGTEQCDGSDLGEASCASQGGSGSEATIAFASFESGDACSEGSCPIRVNGAANTAVNSYGEHVLRPAPAVGDQAGSAWYASQQNVAEGFSTSFRFRMSNLSSPIGADGFAFVIQNSSTSALGATGQNLGYSSIPHSLAVEFDTYSNSGSPVYDPNTNHIAVQSCGAAANNVNHPPQPGSCTIGSVNANPGVNLADGQIHSVSIRYLPPPTATLSVYLDNSESPVLTVGVDLASLGLGGKGSDIAWVGFTSATGFYYEDHDILDWTFTPGAGGSLSCSDQCSFDLSQCVDLCGNGVREGAEECDGSDLAGADCSEYGGGGTVSCDSSCNLDRSACTSAYCGNGVIDEGEQCDGSALGEASCTGFGASGGELGCTPACGYDLSGCTDYCGNGVAESPEDCDGADLRQFTCADFGGNGILSCAYNCQYDTAACHPTGSFPCNVPAESGTVPGHTREETCTIEAHPAKEVSSKITICGDAIPGGDLTCTGTSDPATEGTANILVPDPDVTIGEAFFTPVSVQVIDADGDHLARPGETVQLVVSLLNVGSSPVSDVSAILSSPPRDLDGDGIQDEVHILVNASAYPDGACFAGFPTGQIDCDTPVSVPDPCANITPFTIEYPAIHPGDVGRVYTLTVSYRLGTQLGRSTFTMPLVAGVGSTECGNGIREGDEQCDDGNTLDGDCCSSECRLESAGSACTGDANVCTDDRCNAAGQCEHLNNAIQCDDGDPCTTADTCAAGACAGGPPPSCSDGNPCTDDSCVSTVPGGCVHVNNTGPCSDGNACTTGDTCGGGTCHGGAAPDCNDGNTCTTDSCSPAVGCQNICNNRCNTKGQGYWKRLCQGPHSGDFYTSRDVDCVNNSCTFSSVSSIFEMCAKIDRHGDDDHDSDSDHDDPGEKCAKAEEKFIALLLNVCRCRLQPSQPVNSHCGAEQTVAQVIAASDATLCNPSRTREECEHADCSSNEVADGEALWANTLRISRVGTSIRLTWGPPYAQTDEASAKYLIWRRARAQTPNPPAPFVQVGEVHGSNLTFTDTNAANGSWEYEITSE